MRGYPVHFLIILNQLLLYLLHINKPAIFCVIQQRRGAAPAKRIFMFVQFFFQQKISLPQIFNDCRFRILNEYTTPFRNKTIKLSFFVNRMNFWKIKLLSKQIIIFAVHYCRVHDSRTFFRRNKISCHHIIFLLWLFF